MHQVCSSAELGRYLVATRDLKPGEMEQIQEWELQFSEKYDLVGKLLKPGEESR